MKRQGNVTKFEHVLANPNVEILRQGNLKLIVAVFDGEFEVWGAADVQLGYRVLEEYYRLAATGSMPVSNKKRVLVVQF
jgi:hypothetical protein